MAGGLAASMLVPAQLLAQQASIWSAPDANKALRGDRIRLIDVRLRQEWAETGLAEGAWPISLHEPRFAERLFAARSLAEERPIAIICATGGRSGYVARELRSAGYTGFLDIAEGMLGSARGPGWIAAGLPVVSMTDALAALPSELE